MATKIIITMEPDATPQEETLLACIALLLPGVAGATRYVDDGRENYPSDDLWKKIQ